MLNNTITPTDAWFNTIAFVGFIFILVALLISICVSYKQLYMLKAEIKQLKAQLSDLS